MRNPAVSATIGGGAVHMAYASRDIIPPFAGLRPPLKGGEDLEETLAGIVRGVGIDKKNLSLMLNMSENSPGLFKKVGGYSLLGDFVVNKARLNEARERLTALLRDFHGTSPAEAGMKENELLGGLKEICFPGLGRERGTALFEEVLESLLKEKIIRREGTAVCLSSHRPAPAGTDALIEGELMKIFPPGEFIARRMDELKDMLPFSPEDIKRVLGYLYRNGAVVRLKEESFIASSAVEAARKKLVEHIKDKGGIKASEFRDILGCGRKLAIEILEHFDSVRLTLRQGDVRTLR